MSGMPHTELDDVDVISAISAFDIHAYDVDSYDSN